MKAYPPAVPEKASKPMVHPLGTRVKPRLRHPWKAENPIEVRLAGRVIDRSDLLLLKA